MRVNRFEDREEWMLARKGKITGSRAGDITSKRGGSKKIGFYELIAEKLAVTEEDFDGYVPNETPMQRGTRLESYAIDRFAKEGQVEVDTSLIIWEMDENPNIAVSPDGVISETEAVEAKCLSSARHLEAYLTKKIPDEYFEQCLQYFVCNELLEVLHFVFYDPRIVVKDYFVIEMRKQDHLDDIIMQREHQVSTLEEVDRIVGSLSAF